MAKNTGFTEISKTTPLRLSDIQPYKSLKVTLNIWQQNSGFLFRVEQNIYTYAKGFG